MFATRALAVLIAVLVLTVPAAHAESRYSQQMFRRGLHEPGVVVTSSPLFVLITLRDPSSGTERAAAIPGPFLLGAIEAEYHLELRKATSDKDELRALVEQQRKEVQIALAQPNRVFTFRNPIARKNVEPRYTPAILDEVRHVLASRSRTQIVAAARENQSWLHRIYERKQDAAKLLAYQDAVAHVLLERGILVGQGEPFGLYIINK